MLKQKLVKRYKAILKQSRPIMRYFKLPFVYTYLYTITYIKELLALPSSLSTLHDLRM